MASSPNEFVGMKKEGPGHEKLQLIIQTLFHIPFFRNEIYNQPRKDDVQGTMSVLRALQRLFFRLECSHEQATSCTEFANAFLPPGELLESDPIELFTLLLSRLEESLGASFSGSTRSSIQCLYVPAEETVLREDPFFSLAVPVTNCETLTKAFQQQFTKERLSGANRFMTREGFGLQDALKGEDLFKLPAIFMIQLKRVGFDYNTMMPVKVHSSLSFPEVLDVEQFLAKNAPLHQCTKYQLYAVHVHNGSVQDGHYFSLLRPFPNDPQSPWFKFDDSLVEPFPTENLSLYFGQKKNEKKKSYASAFALVYLREDFVEQKKVNPCVPHWLGEEMAEEGLQGRPKRTKGVKI